MVCEECVCVRSVVHGDSAGGTGEGRGGCEGCGV